MENTLLNLADHKELKITSVELVDIINQFRELESNKTSKKYVELRHTDFMKKVRNEIETLESLEFGDKGNISLISYIDDMNREQPCYLLNRDGMLQMLNSESALVRYKTIEYINNLEDNIKTVSTNNDIKELQNTVEEFKRATEEAKKMYKPSHKMKLDYSKMIKSLTNNKEEYQTVRDWCFGLLNITKWEDSCIDDAPKIIEIIKTVSRLLSIKRIEQINMFN
ncbi:MAG: hypothetical protein E6Y83_21205 [Clostridium butyricum]|nr:hypothetical protein [Clostridium butyricum]